MEEGETYAARLLWGTVRPYLFYDEDRAWTDSYLTLRLARVKELLWA